MCRFFPSDIRGQIRIPGSKHYTQRLLLLSAFSDIPVRMVNISHSQDEGIAAGIAAQCGSDVLVSGSEISVYPSFRVPEEIYCGESATSARMAISLLCLKKSVTYVRMEKSLIRRDFSPLISALESVGCRFETRMGGIMVDASGFFPHSMEIDASLSSQFVSSLLMMLSLLGDSNLKIKITGKEVSAGYVDITQDCLAKFGVNVKREKNEYYVTGKLRNPESQIEVESDMSSSSFLVTMGVLSSRGCIHLLDVVSSGIQPDHHYVDALSRAGFKVKYNTSERTIDSCLSNGDTITVDVDRNPDLAPIASVIGILNSNGVVLKNTLRLTWKESDRRGEIIRLAESFGASVTEDGYDIMIKKGSNPLKPDKLIFNDHRMTMAATVASIASGSETIVGDLDSVKKSYPSFLNDLSSLGVRYSDVT